MWTANTNQDIEDTATVQNGAWNYQDDVKKEPKAENPLKEK